jgi:hypothetical protein
LDNPRIGWCKINDVPWFLFLWANPIHWFDEGHICISIQKNILSYVHIFPHDSQLSSAPTLSDILHVFFLQTPAVAPTVVATCWAHRRALRSSRSWASTSRPYLDKRCGWVALQFNGWLTRESMLKW